MGISFVERIKLSCFTYIYLESQHELVNCMVSHEVLHNTYGSLNMIYMFDTLQYFCDIEMEYVGGTSKWLWLVRILVLRFVIPEACTYSLSLCYEVGA